MDDSAIAILHDYTNDPNDPNDDDLYAASNVTKCFYYDTPVGGDGASSPVLPQVVEIKDGSGDTTDQFVWGPAYVVGCCCTSGTPTAIPTTSSSSGSTPPPHSRQVAIQSVRPSTQLPRLSVLTDPNQRPPRTCTPQRSSEAGHSPCNSRVGLHTRQGKPP